MTNIYKPKIIVICKNSTKYQHHIQNSQPPKKFTYQNYRSSETCDFSITNRNRHQKVKKCQATSSNISLIKRIKSEESSYALPQNHNQCGLCHKKGPQPEHSKLKNIIKKLSREYINYFSMMKNYLI